jgi:hypothetical protein
MRPELEILEDRTAPAVVGIPNPEINVIALGGFNPAVINSALAQNAIGNIVSSITLGKGLPFGDQVLLRASLFFNQNSYHGTDTVIAEVLPPGHPIPTDPNSGQPTTARFVLHLLGGSVPVAILPATVNLPSGPGNIWELRVIQQGWFYQDPPGVTTIQGIPPGPDSQDQLRQPNFLFGELWLLYLLDQSIQNGNSGFFLLNRVGSLKAAIAPTVPVLGP